MPFLLDGNPTQGELSEAINYLLSNFSQTVNADSNTGQINGPTGSIVGYLYKYMSVKYADSFDGSVNFSNTPTGRSYYGLRNSDSSTESINPADYIWTQVTGGFGTTKFFWYQTNGGRQIQIQISVLAPDTSWAKDDGTAIDLDIVSSGNVPVVVESFVSYFAPYVLQVPRTGSPLAPVLTGITPSLYATDKGQIITYSGALSDTGVSFTNNTWRIGNSSTTSFADISYSNITVGDPTDAGDYALWPTPTAMSGSPAYITVPIRYKNSLGVVTQVSVATLQLVYVDPGAQGYTSSTVDISGYTSFVQNVGGAYTPTSATLTALLTNVLSPTYAWSITGATPTTSTASSVVITPTSTAVNVTVSLTVNGSNLLSPITKTITMPIVYDGVPGAAGANGLMSAFPSIYIWTGSSTPPNRPSTTSTYTWSTGAYTPPTGWSASPPTNTTQGNYLWAITIPLTVTATTTTSTLDWTNTSYAIRSTAYNGTNGVNGYRTAILQLYRWSTSTPASFPSGTSTYTWADGTFTLPTTPNVWSLTPGSPLTNATLYAVQQIYTDTGTSATSTVTWSSVTPLSISASVTGAAGSNGTRTAVLQMYKWSATTPTTYPSNTSTYDWNTGLFTAPSITNGWSLNPGTSVQGTNLYGIKQIYTDTATSSTSTVTWSSTSPYPIGYAGADGVNGSNAIILFLTTTSQTFTFDGTSTPNPTSQTIYFTANLQNLTGTATFVATRYDSSGAVLGTVTLGGSGNTRTLNNLGFGAAAYCIVTASLSGYSDTTTVVRLQNGATGTNGTNGVSPIVGLLTNEAAVVAASSGGVVYDFSTAGGNFKVYEGTTDVTSLASFSVSSSTNVSITINSSGIYTITGLTALDGTAILQANYGSVAISKVYSISKSIAGATGSAGSAGTAGSATFVVVRSANNSSAPTDAEVIAVINRTPVAGDIVTVNYNYGNNAVVYRFTTSWVTQATYLTGSLIVDGTITANKLGVTYLSAITSDLGTITSGDFSVGTYPTISGTTMTGVGAHIYGNGNMVVGDSTNNINWNGSALTVNGNIIGTGNVIARSIFNMQMATTLGTDNVWEAWTFNMAYSGRVYFISSGIFNVTSGANFSGTFSSSIGYNPTPSTGSPSVSNTFSGGWTNYASPAQSFTMQMYTAVYLSAGNHTFYRKDSITGYTGTHRAETLIFFNYIA